MNFELRIRTESDTQEFLTWSYEGEYSFYDNAIQQEKIDNIKSLTGSDKAFSVYNEKNELVGNCEFYDVGDDGVLFYAVGVQMKPSLTGQGHGLTFCKAIIEHGRKTLGFNELGIAVADFNKRARRVYEKLGFEFVEDQVWNIRGNDYKFIIMEKNFITQ
ncbi:N-acetyltransferase [Vallitalea longa]|uniref:N-acetyltransferase n=1 Tax=Vallitalea longa TaxID=2936439 RepID=A0A9W5YBK7_9FIRM|nr:GNAT family protein [Vallitalea longa]GKX29486.1 N-acetyltransferase [Vallitalea longa]